MTKDELQAKRAVVLSELKNIEVALCLDEHYIDIIEKENAEVLGNLTKAKEHIRTLISCLIDWVQEGDKDYCHIADAEQFLKADVGTKNYEEQDKILKTRLL